MPRPKVLQHKKRDDDDYNDNDYNDDDNGTAKKIIISGFQQLTSLPAHPLLFRREPGSHSEERLFLQNTQF